MIKDPGGIGASTLAGDVLDSASDLSDIRGRKAPLGMLPRWTTCRRICKYGKRFCYHCTLRLEICMAKVLPKGGKSFSNQVMEILESYGCAFSFAISRSENCKCAKSKEKRVHICFVF